MREESGDANIFGKNTGLEFDQTQTLIQDEHKNLLELQMTPKSDDSYKQQPLPMIRTTPILDVSLPSIDQNMLKLPTIVSKNEK